MNRIALAALFVLFLIVGASAFAASGSGDSPVGLIDTLGPVFSGLTVDPAIATPGDTVTISFSVSEPLGWIPRVWVNSNAATFVSEAGGVYTYTYVVQQDDPSGPATIRIEGADIVGNAGSIADGDRLTLDGTSLPVRAAPVLVALLAVALFVLRRRGRHLPKVSGLLLIAALLLTPEAAAQYPIVSNVTFVQQPVDTGGTDVVITYDLDTPYDPCFIMVSLSKDAGADGFPFPATSVTGDLDDIVTGTGYTIVWDVAADYPGEYLPQAQIRVTAITGDRDYSPWEAPWPEWKWRYSASCQNNLKQMGIVFKMFANESQGERWPPLSSEPGKLMFPEEAVFPEYLKNRDVLLCPGRVDEDPPPYFDDEHYVYLGYVLTCDEDVTAFAGAYAAEIAAGGDFSSDLAATTSYGEVVHRIREGMDAVVGLSESDIPVMMDWPDNHQEAYGGNVLFMDGHVEFMHYPGEFPMTETTIATLAGLAGYVPPTEWREPDPDSPYALPYAPYTDSNDPHGFVEDCAIQIKWLGIRFKMYANESVGETWPSLSTDPGTLLFSAEEFYPEYLTNPGLTLCPGVASTAPAEYFDDRDYVYLGYVLLNDDDAASFASAYSAQLAGGGDFSADLPATTSYGDAMYRIREGIGGGLWSGTSFYSQADIPVLIEWPDNHEGLSGGHVLYMDGHVEWRPYPGEFPMTEATVAALGALAGRNLKTDWADPCPAYSLENDPYGLVAQCRDQCAQLRPLANPYVYGDPDGFYPPLSNEPGRLMVAEEEMYCEHLPNPSLLVCPGAAEEEPEPYFEDQHYVYLGYLVTCDDDVAGFAAAYEAEMAGARDFSGDLPGDVSYGSTIYRLRDDFRSDGLITDMDDPANGYVGPHEIPVLIEWPDNHEALSGGHVLYVDDHVEWHDYPGEWPMTEATISMLDAIATRPGTTEWATRDFTHHNDPYKQALCAYNMKCLVYSAKAFANEHSGEVFPALSSTPGMLMWAAEDVFPHYLHDNTRLNCPGSALAFHPPTIDDQSYVYLGYAVLNQTDLTAFATAYAAELAEGGDFSEDLPAATSYGDTLYRLREGLTASGWGPFGEPLCVGQHQIPTFIEWPDNHGAVRGGNVAYMDGHTEWLPYPSEFPMTEAAMDILTTLAERPPIE